MHVEYNVLFKGKAFLHAAPNWIVMIIMIIMIAIIIVVNNKSRLFEQVEKHLRQYGILLDDDEYKSCLGTSLKLHQNKCLFAISTIPIVLRG